MVYKIMLLTIDMKMVGTAALVVGIIGLVVGILLGLAAKVFAVKVDEKELKVRDELPGNNCGGCGYAGCDDCAKAIAAGKAPANACPVASKEIHQKIAEIMGVSAEVAERKVAFVKCAGTCEKVVRKYNYDGIQDCKMAKLVPGGGDKACSYGCLGLGSCVKACQFDAIHIVNGIAKVDTEKCVACGQCVLECPQHLIELVPESAKMKVQCASHDLGPAVMKVCSAGCIACKICEKNCEFDAIHVVDGIAHIDYEKCTRCGKCAEKCPKKIITVK